MYSNIFEIWRKNGEKVPFAVRKMSWSNPDIYAVVVEVVPDKNNYGKAYGYPTTKGTSNDFFEYDKGWRNNRQIPVAGCFVWEEVTNVVVREEEVKSAMDIMEVNKEIKIKTREKCATNIKGIYELQTIFTFGKYKGMTVTEVIDTNPRYLSWAENNIDGFILAPEVEEILAK